MRRTLRTAVLGSALAASAVVLVLIAYVAYVYTLWVRAMREEGTPGVPPP